MFKEEPIEVETHLTDAPYMKLCWDHEEIQYGMHGDQMYRIEDLKDSDGDLVAGVCVAAIAIKGKRYHMYGMLVRRVEGDWPLTDESPTPKLIDDELFLLVVTDLNMMSGEAKPYTNNAFIHHSMESIRNPTTDSLLKNVENQATVLANRKISAFANVGKF